MPLLTAQTVGFSDVLPELQFRVVSHLVSDCDGARQEWRSDPGRTGTTGDLEVFALICISQV